MSEEKVANALAAFIKAQQTANEKAVEFSKAVADRYKVDLETIDPQAIIDEAEGRQNGTFYLLGVSSVMEKALDVIAATMLDPEAAKDFSKESVSTIFEKCCQWLTFLEDAITNHATGLDFENGLDTKET